MKHLGLKLVSLILFLVLTACGGGGSGGGGSIGGISGTVTAPAGVTVADTAVFACYLGSCTSPQTKELTLTANAQSARYEFTGLEVGQSYSVVAWKDVNGDGRIDPGDYVGETEDLVVVPAQNVNVTMEGGSSSISGVLIYPGSVNPFPTATGSGLERLELPDGFVLAPHKGNDLNANLPVEVVPGEVLVTFKGGASAQQLTTLRVGDTVRRTPGRTTELRAVRVLELGTANLQLYRANGLTQAETLDLVNALRARPDVASAYPNWVLHSFKTPNDEGYPFQWHYEAMNLPAAWDVEDGAGGGVTVAVVDTGAVGHPDLVENLVAGYDFISDPATAGDGDGRDADATDISADGVYHGSHVAGTIAAQTNNGNGVAGVSWGAKLVPVRVLGDGGGTFADILDGVAWAAGQNVAGVPANPNPASVINMSLGGNIGEACPAEVNQFFGSLAAAGVVTVAAAGNDGIDAVNTFPANCQGLITVGATGPQNTRAPYSNYGSAIDVMATGGDVNQSFSVGGDEFPAGVLSTVAVQTADGLAASYDFYQGTSMASPHVAGIVALMLAQNPGLSFDQVRARLQAAATPLSPGECERPSGADCGAGLVNAATALTGGGGAPPPPPPPPTENLVTYVAAFYCRLGCNDFDLNRSVLVEVEITSDTVPYTIPDLEPGTYYMAAWQDLNGNGDVDDREPFGVYVGPNNNPEVTLAAGATVTNIVIVMQPYSASSQGGTSALTVPDLPSSLAELALPASAQPAERPSLPY